MNPKVFMNPRECDTYFICNKDCVGMVSFSSIQKCTAALCCLAYGDPSNAADDYPHMAESTCPKTFYRFCRAVIAAFDGDYLRAPTADDTTRILAQNAA
jgi:hypothetical protein